MNAGAVAEAPTIAVPGRTTTAQVLRLATPVFVEQVLLYLVGFSDTVLTGRFLAVEHLAAVTVCSYLLWFLGSLMIVVSAGATALVARFVGAGRWDQAVRIPGQSVGLGFAVGLGLSIGAYFLAPSLVHQMGLRAGAATSAVAFLRIVLASSPLMACLTVGNACLRGAGDTRTGMWVMTLVNTINIGMSWALSRGLGPFPTMGFNGVALGTALAEGTGGLVILAVLARGRSGLLLRPDALLPRVEPLERILRISLPAAGESLVNGLCQLAFLAMINRLGDVATAAHGVAIRCEAIAFLSVTAFSVAASTLTGQYLGAGRPDLAARASRGAWRLGTITLIVLGSLLYVFARPLFGLFLGRYEGAVAALGVPVLRLVSFGLPALATITILSGSLRGAGDTRWPLAIVMIGYLGVRLPMTWWMITPVAAGGLGLGLYGAWIAMLCDLALRAVLIAARFLQGGWTRSRV